MRSDDEMVTRYLLEIKDEGETVAFIDDQGEFVCLDRMRMVRSLRLDVIRIENFVVRLREFGVTFNE